MDEHNGIINVNKDAGMTSSGVVTSPDSLYNLIEPLCI